MHKSALDLNQGVAMIVTDLHGHWPVYEHLRDTFLEYHQVVRADYFVICGDLIHGSGRTENDHSVAMLLDVM